MKVSVKNWRGTKEHDLADVLESEIASEIAVDSEAGQLEDMERTLNKTRRVLGRLLETLCDRKIITLEEAYAFVDGYDEIKEIL